MTDSSTAPAVLLPHHVPAELSAELRESLGSVVDGELLVAHTPAESLDLAPRVEGIVTGRLSEELLAAATALRWVQALSAGVDHYDRAALADRGIVLTNASGVHAEPIGEQVLGYMLAFERGFLDAARQQARGVWERIEGGELRGKTVGIVGVGAIGTRIAELASAFGTTVLGTKRDTSTVPDAVDECLPAGEHAELCRRADYLVLACPLTDETEGLIGRPEFRLLSSDAVVVNIARGEVIDQDALVRALQYGSIRGAALDVFETEPLPADSPLWTLSNVLVTPHMAGSTPRKHERWREIVATNYEALRADDPDGYVNRVV